MTYVQNEITGARVPVNSWPDFLKAHTTELYTHCAVSLFRVALNQSGKPSEREWMVSIHNGFIEDVHFASCNVHLTTTMLDDAINEALMKVRFESVRELVVSHVAYRDYDGTWHKVF